MRCFASVASPVHAVRNMNKGIKLPVFTRKPQMSEPILFNKPYGDLPVFRAPQASQPGGLRPHPRRLSRRPAGHRQRGLLLLTADGALQHQISHPGCKPPKPTGPQVEGIPDDDALAQLRARVDLGDFVTQPAQVRRIDPPSLWPRTPHPRAPEQCRTAGWKSSSTKAKPPGAAHDR